MDLNYVALKEILCYVRDEIKYKPETFLREKILRTQTIIKNVSENSNIPKEDVNYALEVLIQDNCFMYLEKHGPKYDKDGNLISAQITGLKLKGHNRLNEILNNN